MCEGLESTEMKEVQHAPYVKEEQLIGANPCTRGPAYWCATVENAVDCNVRKMSTCSGSRIVSYLICDSFSVLVCAMCSLLLMVLCSVTLNNTKYNAK